MFSAPPPPPVQKFLETPLFWATRELRFGPFLDCLFVRRSSHFESTHSSLFRKELNATNALAYPKKILRYYWGISEPLNCWKIEGYRQGVLQYSFLRKRKLWLRKKNCSTWFSLEHQPLEFSPIRFASGQMLAEDRVADNRGLIEFLFGNTELLTIFLEKKNILHRKIYNKNLPIFAKKFSDTLLKETNESTCSGFESQHDLFS